MGAKHVADITVISRRCWLSLDHFHERSVGPSSEEYQHESGNDEKDWSLHPLSLIGFAQRDDEEAQKQEGKDGKGQKRHK